MRVMFSSRSSSSSSSRRRRGAPRPPPSPAAPPTSPRHGPHGAATPPAPVPPLAELTGDPTAWPVHDCDAESSGDDKATDEDDHEQPEKKEDEEEEDAENRSLNTLIGHHGDGVLDGSCRRSARLAAARAQRRLLQSRDAPAAVHGRGEGGGEAAGGQELAAVDAYSFEGEEEWDAEDAAEASHSHAGCHLGRPHLAGFVEKIPLLFAGLCAMDTSDMASHAYPCLSQAKEDGTVQSEAASGSSTASHRRHSVDSPSRPGRKAPAGDARRQTIGASAPAPPVAGRKSSLKSGARAAAPALQCAFSSVDVREHERIAGDHPAVGRGVPLALGWGYRQHRPIDLDEFEEKRGPPRAKGEMVVPATVREKILREDFDVPVDDIIAALREVDATKKQRRHTVGTDCRDGLAELTQSARRKLTRFVRRTSASQEEAKEERELWAGARQIAVKDYLKAQMEADATGSALKKAPSPRRSASADAALPGADGAAAGARRCTFSSVDVREHERIAGDHPAVGRGVPLALGWGYRQHRSISLDEFEACRGPPRAKVEMVVPSAVREQILRDEFDVPVDDILTALRAVAAAKKRRGRRGAGAEKVEGLAEAAESARRKWRRFVGGTTTAGSAEEEEQGMWARAHHSALSECSHARAE